MLPDNASRGSVMSRRVLGGFGAVVVVVAVVVAVVIVAVVMPRK